METSVYYSDTLLIGIIILVMIAVLINFLYIRRKGKYAYAVNHVPAYTLFGLPICIAVLLLFTTIKNDVFGTVKDAIINIGSNYLIFIILGLARGVEWFIKNRNEDKEKLTDDFNSLVEKYNKEPLVSYKGIKYPVSNLGGGDICVFSNNKLANLSNCIIINDSKKEYSLPGLIEDNFIKILKIHDTSVLYNNLNIRATELSLSGNRLTISTERTYYYYSMVTNRASDYEWEAEGVTVRSIFEPGPVFQPLNQSYLSNHLGFNGFIKSIDDCIVFVQRSKDMSIGKRTFGDSIGASLKTKYALDENGEFTSEKLVDSIIYEIEDELKIPKSCIDNLHIINAYRDGLESGKPQLLFYAEVNQKAYDINRYFISLSKVKQIKLISHSNKKNAIKAIGSKEKRKLKKELRVITDGNKLVWLKVQSLPNLVFKEKEIVYEGDKANGFFSYSGDGSNQIKHINKLTMLPSASASLVLFMDYYQNRRTTH